MRMNGKVAIVTGGAMGIGHAICETLAAQGAAIVIADLAGAQAAAERLQQAGHRAIGVTADVSSELDAARMVADALDHFGRIDVLVNNAAIYSTLQIKPFEELTVADWKKMFDVNVIGQFLCCRAVLPALRRQGAGRIISISSAVAFKGKIGRAHV